MLLCIFVRHNFHDVLNAAIQRGADLQQNLRGDMAVLAHLGDGRQTDTGLLSHVFFLHILIDEQFPKLLITYRHSAFLPICKNALPPGRALGLLQPYCQGLFQHLATLFIMVAHLGRKSKKMIADNVNDVLPCHIRNFIHHNTLIH